MLPTVLLLLSVWTVRANVCEDLSQGTVSNLQESIKREQNYGFPQVFPNNYLVQHHFNGSTQCEDSCCVFSAAVFLTHSWMELLQHLDHTHLKHSIITELIMRLKSIWQEGFQEPPDPRAFPSVYSSPGSLLTFTSEILSKWINMNCPVGKNACVFPTQPPQSIEDKQEKEYTAEAERLVEEQCGNERERVKRCATVIPSNRDVRVSAASFFFLFLFLSLGMLLGELLK